MKRRSDKSCVDELRPEYDFGKLKIVAHGPGRKGSEGPTIKLEPDVAEMFPDSQSVNQALRLLMRAARKQAASLK